MRTNETTRPVSVYAVPEAAPPPEPAPPPRRMARRVWRALGILLLLFAVGTAAVLVPVHLTLKDRWEPFSAEAEPALAATDRFGVMNILLIGVDARDGETVARSDTLILMRADIIERKVWLLSIPRDTRVDIPGLDGPHKVNAAHALGGPALAIDAAESVTLLPIHHYAEIDFAGFQELVDALGGVTVDVPVEILDRQAATASEGGQAMHIPAGPQLLDGEHALTFARSRAYRDGDFTRMRNQQTLLRAIMKETTRPANVFRLPAMAHGFSEHVVTDLGVPGLSLVALAGVLGGSEGLSTATLPGTWESPYVWVDEASRATLLDSMEEGLPFEAPADPLSSP